MSFFKTMMMGKESKNLIEKQSTRYGRLKFAELRITIDKQASKQANHILK